MSIHSSIPEICLFQNLILKIRGQGHGSKFKVTFWDQHLINSHSFHSIITLPIHHIQLFQNLTLKIQGQGRGWGQSARWYSESNIWLTYIPFVPCQLAFLFLRYGYLKNWPWKSSIKLMKEIQVQGHIMGPKSYQLTSRSFHVNRPAYCWDMAISKFDLEVPRSSLWVWSKVKLQWVQHVTRSRILIDFPFLW